MPARTLELSKAATPVTVAQWADAIIGCWRLSVLSIIRTGQMLAQAKEGLSHDEWLELVDEHLPWCYSSAQRLIIIGADTRLISRVQNLPASWGALYEITKLPAAEIDRGIKDGLIRPDMKRRDISIKVKQGRRIQRERELGGVQCALPEQKFGVILADPEWRFEPWSRQDRHGPRRRQPLPDLGAQCDHVA